MSRRNVNRLQKAYSKYRTKRGKKNVLGFFHALMPEIIFRTTKLEGESVTRRMISSLLK